MNSTKTNVSVIFTIAADGTLLPFLVVTKPNICTTRGSKTVLLDINMKDHEADGLMLLYLNDGLRS